MTPTTVLIVGHGSRVVPANQEFEDLVGRYRERRPEYRVTHGYIELAEPQLGDALTEAAQDAKRVVLLPLFLLRAGHVKNDIARAIEKARQDFPQVKFSLADPLGVHPLMPEIVFERASSADPLLTEAARQTTVIFVGRGSTHPDANSDLFKLARLFAEGRDFGCVLPCFIAVTRPFVDETLELAARLSPERLVVVPYFFFAGLLVNQLNDMVQEFAQKHPAIETIMAPRIGVHIKLLDLLDERLQQALEGRTPLPCDVCQYRAARPGLAAQAV